MKQQCRSCGDWFEECEMFETDYRTYSHEEDEMVCKACYDECYGRCSDCGAIREDADLMENDEGRLMCNLETVAHQD